MSDDIQGPFNGPDGTEFRVEIDHRQPPMMLRLDAVTHYTENDEFKGILVTIMPTPNPDTWIGIDYTHSEHVVGLVAHLVDHLGRDLNDLAASDLGIDPKRLAEMVEGLMQVDVPAEEAAEQIKKRCNDSNVVNVDFQAPRH